ncbi:MAG: 50S ribosomal protein L29 [Thaumarchaeota archaeon]|nr:50S ribosomal protein L29 [Nitrososphaerota archaeon]|tara:strand:+ start:28 stop:237 length:210 start_codon:yes stop_codon:yes gene_type:complete
MPSLRTKDLRKQGRSDLRRELVELRAEIAKLETSVARGTIRKESGKVRNVRRNIARLLTVLNEPIVAQS